jgi:hypothetical protein
MGNLTITIDEDTLRRARIRALEQGTSVNALLREYLEAYAGGGGEKKDAVRDLIALSKRSRSRRGRLVWKRDELHERD